MRGSRIGKGAGSGGPPPGKFKLLRVTENTEVSENPPTPAANRIIHRTPDSAQEE